MVPIDHDAGPQVRHLHNNVGGTAALPNAAMLIAITICN
jgi:hypothetical protein